jgi:CheY-like chemotaxis protein
MKVKRILNRLGIQKAEIVDNGHKAVDHETAQEFDIVLMNMQMISATDSCSSKVLSAH